MTGMVSQTKLFGGSFELVSYAVRLPSDATSHERDTSK
jgi:hypothetical protein